MSAIRNNARSSDARRNRASPYTDGRQKSQGWGISKLLNFFNPLRIRSESPLPETPAPGYLDSVDRVTKGVAPEQAAERLADRGQQISSSLNGRGTLGGTSSSSVHGRNRHDSLDRGITGLDLLSPSRSGVLFDESPSRSKNLETVVSFLQSKQDQPMNAIEVEGLVSLINKSSSESDLEPFRFSTSPSPARGTTPHFGLGPSASSPSVSSSTASPRKALSKNPNGSYRWQGGGSAKPRNRYRSPAFGASQPSPTGLKLSPPPNSTPTDTKRRKVGEDTITSYSMPSLLSTPPRSAAPSPAQIPSSAAVPFPATPGSPSPSSNGSPSKPGAQSRTPARRPVVQQFTAPAHPSPLRQAWGAQSDTSSSPNSSPAPAKPTNAATFMTELIKGATPPKKPDLSNPYQTASPVKPRASTRKVAPKRSRATGKPTPPAAPEVEEPSPQAIIEATVPKGSKRTRPPPESAKHSPERERSMSSSVEQDGMEIDEEVTAPAPKKHKKAMVNGNGRPSSARQPSAESVTVEEMDLDEAPATPILRPAEIIEPQGSSRTPAVPVPPAPATGSTFFAASSSSNGRPVKSSLPKEPSKLRFSYQPETSSTTSSSSAPTVVDGLPPPSTESPFAPKLEGSSRRASLASVHTLPTFDFAPPPSLSAVSAGKRKAEAISAATLPSFSFDIIATPLSSAPASAHAPTPAPAPTTGGFNWAASGMAPPKISAGEWKCGDCASTNQEHLHDKKCYVCDAPKPGAATSTLTPPAPTTTSNGSGGAGGGFNWAAAGDRKSVV